MLKIENKILKKYTVTDLFYRLYNHKIKDVHRCKNNNMYANVVRREKHWIVDLSGKSIKIYYCPFCGIKL